MTSATPTGSGAVGRVKRLLSRGDTAPLAAQVEALAARVAELEGEVSECRRHHHRTAELTDVVQELLVPLATGDAAGARRVIDAYTDRL